MNLIRLMAVCLALFWVPLTNHCRIEAATGEAFLHSHADDGHGHDHDSDHAGCLMAESGDYKSEVRPISLIPSADALVFLAAWFQQDLDEPLVAAGLRQPAGQPPPELAVSWTFVSRTALPPRAPSLAS